MNVRMKSKTGALRRRTSLTIGVAAALLPALTLAQVFSNDADPFGKTYRDWVAEWVQWSYSIPAAVHPLIDPPENYCAIGQRGKVWFLGGTFGGSATRTCTIPAETGVFFPLVVLSCDNVGMNPPLSPAGLRDLCASYLGQTVLDAELDGKTIKNLGQFRFKSSVFSYSVTDNNLFGYPAGVVYPTVADGYFLMLKPLSPGMHTLHFHGGLPPYGFDVNVSYTLNVVPLISP